MRFEKLICTFLALFRNVFLFLTGWRYICIVYHCTFSCFLITITNLLFEALGNNWQFLPHLNNSLTTKCLFWQQLATKRQCYGVLYYACCVSPPSCVYQLVSQSHFEALTWAEPLSKCSECFSLSLEMARGPGLGITETQRASARGWRIVMEVLDPDWLAWVMNGLLVLWGQEPLQREIILRSGIWRHSHVTPLRPE